MTLRFVHAADLHLDSPLRGVRASGVLRETLQRATFGALQRIVSLCLAERVHFLVLAGDLFDARDRSLTARLFLASELARLSAAGIETFIVHGNHDPLVATAAAVAPLAEHVHVFGTEWEERPVLRDGRCIARVQGVSYGRERMEDNLSRQFSRQGPEPTVGVLHANLGGEGGPHANYAPCTLADLDEKGLSYWALGHVHTRAVHPLPSGGVAVYPGNPQGRHVLEDGERGCFLVELPEDGRAQLTFMPVATVRWHRIQVPVEQVASVEALEAQVSDRIDECCPAEASSSAHVVRLELSGRGPVHAELRAAGARDALEEHLREVLAARRVPVVLESLLDATRAELDWDVLRTSPGLPADVLRAAANPSSVQAALAEDRSLAGLGSALKKLGLPPLDLTSEALLAAAAERAVELLMSEEA